MRSRSDWQAARGEAGNMGSSPVPSSADRVPGAGVPQPGSGRGSSGPRVAFAAQMLSLAPGLGGRSPEHLGPGRQPGGGSAEARAGGGHVGPRAGHLRGARPDLQ